MSSGLDHLEEKAPKLLVGLSPAALTLLALCPKEGLAITTHGGTMKPEELASPTELVKVERPSKSQPGGSWPPTSLLHNSCWSITMPSLDGQQLEFGLWPQRCVPELAIQLLAREPGLQIGFEKPIEAIARAGCQSWKRELGRNLSDVARAMFELEASLQLTPDEARAAARHLEGELSDKRNQAATAYRGYAPEHLAMWQALACPALDESNTGQIERMASLEMERLSIKLDVMLNAAKSGVEDELWPKLMAGQLRGLEPSDSIQDRFSLASRMRFAYRAAFQEAGKAIEKEGIRIIATRMHIGERKIPLVVARQGHQRTLGSRRE